MRKTLCGALLLASASCYATVNQLEFHYGRGSPRSSYHFGDMVTQEGPRGPEWSADFLHRNAPYTFVGVGGGIFRSGDEISATFAPDTTSSISLKMSSILALYRADLSPNPRLTPYLIAGLGWVRNSLSVTSTPTTAWADTGTSEPRKLVEDSKVMLGYALGLGLDWALTDRLYIGAEGRYQGSTHRTFQTTPDGQAATGQIQVTVPLGAYLFGLKVGVKY